MFQLLIVLCSNWGLTPEKWNHLQFLPAFEQGSRVSNGKTQLVFLTLKYESRLFYFHEKLLFHAGCVKDVNEKQVLLLSG